MLYTAIIVKAKLAFGVIVCQRSKQPRNGTGGLKLTCKDCIHYEACHDMYYEEHATRHFDPEKHNAEKECGYFKDRSRFVELPPCKEGDSVYSICFCYGEGDTITEWTVVDIFLLSSKEEGNSVGIRLKDECIFISISPCELGNRYFLTKEEAEQALKLKTGDTNA